MTEIEEEPAALPAEGEEELLEEQEAAAAAAAGVVKPGAKRRSGKVVGFVDLSKRAVAARAAAPRRATLRSKDDVAARRQARRWPTTAAGR